MKTIHTTREEWLSAAVSAFRPWFTNLGYKLPNIILVSVGFPSVRALSTKNRVVGQCWPHDLPKSGPAHIFISPIIGDASHVCDVLIHELVHAVETVANAKCGHKGQFTVVARAVGLTGKMTSTKATPDLVKRLNFVLPKLGIYPHAKLDPAMSPVRKQSTRLLKAQCPDEDCGYVIRVTQKWIDDAGLPTCPCGEQFKEV